MTEILSQAANVAILAALLFVAVLFIGFTVAPKRTRKTVNYLLNAYKEYRQAKEHPEEKIEVPDFETRQIPKVPDPRKKP